MMPQRFALAESAAQLLRAHIDAGRWPDVLPGERVLCEELEISRPTLRQALKALEREGRLEVAQGRQRRIIGWRSPAIPADRRQVIGLLSSLPLQALPPFVLFWIGEVRSSLAKTGRRLEFHVSHGLTAQNPGRALERLVHGAPASLWILLLAPSPVQQWFQKQKVPCVMAGSCAPGVDLPSVDLNYRAASRHAVGVFRRAGHTRLALVVPEGDLTGDAESEAGFTEAAGGGLTPLILRHNGSQEAILEQMERCLRLAAPPTGFLVARSAHALAVLTFLMRRGVQFPSQAAMIARDDDAFLDFVTPRMARYRGNPVTYARHLTHAIQQASRSGPLPTRPVRLMPSFCAGETA